MPTPVEYMRQRLKNAKSRALFWSGNPSVLGKRFSTREHNTGSADIQYEAALDDVQSWLDAIEAATGKRPKYEPPREKVVRGMGKIYRSLAKGRAVNQAVNPHEAAIGEGS